MTAVPGQSAPPGPSRPDVRVGGHPAYVWCFVLALPLAAFSGSWELLGVPIGPDRLLLGAGLVLLVLDPWAWRGRRLRPVHVVVLATVVWAAVSASAGGTLTTSYGFFALLDRLALPFALMLVAPMIFRTSRRRDLLLRALVVLGLYLGITAVFEQVAPELVFPRYIVDPAVGIQFGRARGPFVESVANGLVIVTCAFAATLAIQRFDRVWRLLAWAAVLACTVGALLTLTRAIWVGAVVGLLAAGLAGHRRRRALPIALVALAVGVGVLLAVSPALRSASAERAGNERSVLDRQNVNAAGLRAVEQHPLTGVGWARWVDVGQNYVRQADDYALTNTDIEVHNVPLARAAEIGLPGAALWLACVIAGPGLAAVRRARGDLDGWRLVLIGAGTCWLVASMLGPVPYALPNQLVFVLAGIVLGPYLLRDETETESGTGSDVPAQPTATGRPG
jgi:putative inorganic carbon (HCO3(-)) transporter